MVYPLPKLKSPNRFRFLPSKLYKLFSDSKGASLLLHPQEFNFESHSDIVNIKFSSVDSDGITIANYNLVVHVVYKEKPKYVMTPEQAEQKEVVSYELKMDAKGDLEVKFSTEMRSYATKYYNSTIIEMYITPALERHLAQEEEWKKFNITSLNFTWETQSFEGD